MLHGSETDDPCLYACLRVAQMSDSHRDIAERYIAFKRARVVAAVFDCAQHYGRTLSPATGHWAALALHHDSSPCGDNLII